MAVGRSRNSKRSSYSSYTSTITTIIFIVLCVLGVWMLTSNSIASPQTIRHTTSVASSSNNDVLPSSLNNDKKDLPAYEDNPGELPDDAIKSDDSRQLENTTVDDSTNSQDNKVVEQQDTVTAGTMNQNNETTNKGEKKSEETTTTTITTRPVTESNGDRGIDSSAGETEIPQVKEVGDEQETEKQTGSDNQVSEESTVTQAQGQQQEQTNKEHSKKIDEDQQQSDNGTIFQQIQNDSTTSNEETNVDQQQQQPLQEQQQRVNDVIDNNNNNINKNVKEPQSSDQDQGSSNNEDHQSEQPKHDTKDKIHEEDSQSQSQEQQYEISEKDQQKQIEEQLRKQRLEDQQNSESNVNASDESLQPVVSHKTKEEDSHDNENSDQVNQQGHSQKSEAQSEDDNSQKFPDPNVGQSESNTGQTFTSEDNTGIPKESKESKKAWLTQATQSENQKERGQTDTEVDNNIFGYTWQLCNVTAGPDYIPCLDNDKALRRLRSTKHFEHRERHCPEQGPMCLVPCPEGYKKPIEWPKSREKIWYHNVPHPMLADVKGHQNWVKVSGEFLTFPGGGTQFIHGALHYIDFLQKSQPNIKWGKHTRVVLDVGCGVASFGGYLFERDVLTMSFAPKDEHEAQVQFALERGIPAISAVMGSQRLPFPSRVFDLVHCARCRVPWHAEGGRLLLELNRVLRPGGFFIWSATPVYQKLEEDVQIWKEMTSLTTSICWELVTIQKDKLNSVGAAIYRKPRNNECYEQRKQKTPPMCKDDDDPNAAWYVPLRACMHKLPVDESERGAKWPVVWPRRLRTPPARLNNSQMGVYGKPAPQDFVADYEHWKRVVSNSYMSGLGISWSGVRNVMDMRAVYGGFAAALKDLQMWVFNVVNVDSPDTLPIIYERGLFGIYHDWCESFSTYPRTYDLLHADHLFSKLKKRCKLVPVMAEVDRIVRPGGKLIVRDESSAIGEVENILKSLHWEVHLTFSKDHEGILSAQKENWRPDTYVEMS